MMDVMTDRVEEKNRVLKFTKLRYYLCDKAYDAVAHILVFGFETLEEVLQQATGKTRRGGLIVIIHGFLLLHLPLQS